MSKEQAKAPPVVELQKPGPVTLIKMKQTMVVTPEQEAWEPGRLVAIIQHEQEVDVTYVCDLVRNGKAIVEPA